MLKVIAEQEHYLLISDGQALPSSKGVLGNSTRCAQASDTGSILAMRPSPS